MDMEVVGLEDASRIWGFVNSQSHAMFKESVFIMPSILHLNNSYQHLASIMRDMARGGEHLIFVTRPNKPQGMLIVAPYHAPTP